MILRFSPTSNELFKRAPLNWHIVIFLLLFSAFGPGCKSPFKVAEIQNPKKHIEGKVRLSDNGNPEGILIYLEGFNVSTRANSQGEYSIDLPESSLQGVNTAGADGLFKVYYYVANYYIKTSDVIIINGEFVFGKGDLRTDGTFTATQTLFKFLDIRTELSNTLIKNTFNGTLSIDVILAPLNSTDSIEVVFPGNESGLVDARIFLENSQTGTIETILPNRYSLREQGEAPVPQDKVTSRQIVNKRPLIFSQEFDWRPSSIRAGTYNIIPYVLMTEEPIPEKIFSALRFNVQRPASNYQTIPFNIQMAQLQIDQAE